MQSRGSRTRGWVWGETEEATRGDYEDNPHDRSVAKSAHSERLRSAARKGKMSRGERCIHSMETDGLQYGHQRGANSVWQQNETIVGRVERGEGRGERTKGEGTGNPRTCSEKYRVTCKGTGMREIACLTHATPGQRQRRDGRRRECPSFGPFHTGQVQGRLPPACSPPPNLSSLSNGGAPNLSLAVNRRRELLKISLSITSPAFWPHFPTPPSIGGELANALFSFFLSPSSCYFPL